MKQYSKLGVICAMTFVTISPAWAAAIANHDQLASASGAANAVVAGADDLSAVVFNPAGLAWQRGTQLLIASQTRFRSMSGTKNAFTFSGDLGQPDVTSFAISWAPLDSHWGIAGSITTPYSVRTGWASAPFANKITEGQLNFERYSVNTFWRIDNDMALSLGVDSYKTGIYLLNSTAPLFAASGWSSAGLNAGFRWQFAPFWYVGAHYRQGVDASISDSVGAQSDLKLPDEMAVGLAHDFMDDELRLEMDIKQTAWSSFKDIQVSSSGVVSQNYATDLRDVTDVSLGLTWFWRNDTQLRFGYAYEQGANRLSTMQPVIEDQTGHRLTTGFGGVMMGMHLDVAYSVLWCPDAKVSGAHAGDYTDLQQNISFSLTKKF